MSRITSGAAAAGVLGLAIATLAILTFSTTNGATSRESAMHAKGYFDVTLIPQKPDNAPAQEASLGRMSIDKQYHGDIDGIAKGEMLATGDGKQHGAYVAIEKITATLNGRSGSFSLVHRAAMNQGTPERWEIFVVPGSGTEQLAGISGTFTIINRDGKHFYELDYSLPGN